MVWAAAKKTDGISNIESLTKVINTLLKVNVALVNIAMASFGDNPTNKVEKETFLTVLD